MDKPPALSARLVAIRKDFGWSQYDLARHLCISQATVSYIERDMDVSDVVRKVSSDFVRMVDAGMIRASDLPPLTEPTEGALS